MILLSSEDDRGRTIRPRLDAAGADPDRVFTFDIRAVPMAAPGRR